MLREAEDLRGRLPSRVARRFTAVSDLVTEYDMLGYAARARLWLGEDGRAKNDGEQALAALRSAPEGARLTGKDAGVRLDLALALARLGSPKKPSHSGSRDSASPAHSGTSSSGPGAWTGR